MHKIYVLHMYSIINEVGNTNFRMLLMSYFISPLSLSLSPTTFWSRKSVFVSVALSFRCLFPLNPGPLQTVVVTYSRLVSLIPHNLYYQLVSSIIWHLSIAWTSISTLLVTLTMYMYVVNQSLASTCTILMMLPYSQKYWWELNLGVGPQITIVKILADLNLAVQ